MAESMVYNELNDESGDFGVGATANSDAKVDSTLIRTILSKMKCEFNKDLCNAPPCVKDEYEDHLSSTNLSSSLDTDLPFESDNTSESDSKKPDLSIPIRHLNGQIKEVSPPEDSLQSFPSNEEPVDIKPNILNEESNSVSNFDSIPFSDEVIDLPLKMTHTSKDSNSAKESFETVQLEDKISNGRKSSKSPKNFDKSDPEISLKRSSRRMSREYSHESVLQNAIARKEKSFSSLNLVKKNRRRSSRLSEDKVTVKLKSPTQTSTNDHIDESISKGVPDNITTKNVYSKTNKSPSLSNSDVNDNDNSHDSSAASTPQKSLKILSSPLENDFQGFSAQIENVWEKGTDSSTKFNTTSCKAKKKKFSFTTECYLPPVKKPRLDSPPPVPEPNEALPQETIVHEMASTTGNCECQKLHGVYPSKRGLDSPYFCKATETYDNMVVGCCNFVDLDIPLRRSCVLTPFLPMCQMHVERLLRHNCCPNCGHFCTQGPVYVCTNKNKEVHLFHKNCVKNNGEVLLCPHCSSDNFSGFKLTNRSQYPVFFRRQRWPLDCPRARMSITKETYKRVGEKDKKEILELLPQNELQFNKMKFTTDGLPTPEKEKLEKLLHVLASRNDSLPRTSPRAFYQACKHGETEKVLSMLGNETKQLSVIALHAAARNGHIMVVHLLVQSGIRLNTLDKSQYTPLMLAALNGHNDVVKYLVKSGADVSFKGSDGMTALHLAAKIGNVVACHYLLSAAKAPRMYVDSLDDGHWTPLVWAAENRHHSVVRYLLGRGANPHIHDSEMNIALHWAAYSGSTEITEDLLNYKSNVNLPNVHGDTPLHIAARQGADECVTLLMIRGARTDVRNKAGQLPIDCVLPQFQNCRVAIELNMKIKKVTFRSRIACNDLSKGREQHQILVVNDVDDDPVPTDFKYITENCETFDLPIDKRITSLSSCNCEDSCSNISCKCNFMSLRSWYDSNGRLVPDFNYEDPPMLFECNQKCGCDASLCQNRVVQKGLKVKLQVLKMKKKNWGVITSHDILKGTFVCEYIGEIIPDHVAEKREDDSYLFDLDNLGKQSYCIDARNYGNITRFVNHSCRPNLVPVRVFVKHQDLNFPRIAFFAGRDIAPNEELSFDYGEKFWVIKYKNFTCSCEEDNCRYSSATIHETLVKYKEKLKLEDTL